QAAHDRLLTFMDQLDLPEVYRRYARKLHTSSAGQKYGVAVELLNANYSFKYLGKDAGVSPYTCIDERHFLWHHEVISASERAAAYVMTLLVKSRRPNFNVKRVGFIGRICSDSLPLQTSYA